MTRTARHASFSIASGTVYEAAKEEKEFLKNSVNSIKGLDRKLMTHQISSQQWQHRMEESHKISDELVKSKTIHKISSEFITNAKLYGGVIIREKNLPPELKSIQPIDLGGVAGGTKYMCGGILFKFANDVELPSGSWMYGGGAPAEEAAHKAAGHERKALYAIIRAGVEGCCSYFVPNFFLRKIFMIALRFACRYNDSGGLPWLQAVCTEHFAHCRK